MPTSLLYSISSLSLSPPASLGSVPVFPIPYGGSDCGATSFDKTHFLGLFDRVLSPDWLYPLKVNPDSGYELLAAFAAIGERVSSAIERLECGSFFLYAGEGSKATVTVTLYRDSFAAGAFTLKAGSVVQTSRGGRRFATLTDVAFGGADLTKAVSAEAEGQGFEWDVRGERGTLVGSILPGEVDTPVALLEDPPYADPTIKVKQAPDASGGNPPELEGLAADRGLARTPGESADQLRTRARTLPDTVSIGAIKRAVGARLDPLGLAWDVIEVFEHRYQECWDAPSPNAGTPTYQATAPTAARYNNRTFAYDDPRPVSPFQNRVFDAVEARATIIVVVSTTQTLDDLGFAYDDPGSGPSSFRNPSTGYGRQTSAYDTDSSMDATKVFGPAYDGFDAVRAAAYAALVQDLQAVKAAGVLVIFETPRP